MIDGKTVLVVVPARGGSKGIPLKNLRPLLGVPLVARVGGLVQELAFVDRAVVSTDHPQIAEASRRSGLDAPFVRPQAISGDLVGDLEVLVHALQEVEGLDNRRYDVIVMLQPTSPMREAADVTAAVEKLVWEGWDAVWTVSKIDPKYHPLKILRLTEAGLSLYDPGGRQIIARQQLGTLYYRNGAAYAFTRRCLLEEKTIMPAKWSGVVVEGRLVSVDTDFDIELAEWLISRREAKG